MERKIQIAGIQLASLPERERNISKADMLVELAAGEGAKVIALPPLFSSPWFPAAIDNRNFELAEGEDGPSVAFLREAAMKHKVVVIGGVFEADGDKHYNTAYVAGPDGLIGKYRKVHVPQIPLWEERAYFSPGDLGFPVFETPYGKIGVLICWDVFFPEAWRVLALNGAELVVALTSSAFEHSHRKWERAISAAAHANGFFVLRVNRVGKEDKQEFYGKSFSVGPDGEFIENPSGSSEGIVVSEIDLGDVSEIRNEWVFLRDRRPGEYMDVTRKAR